MTIRDKYNFFKSEFQNDFILIDMIEERKDITSIISYIKSKNNICTSSIMFIAKDLSQNNQNIDLAEGLLDEIFNFYFFQIESLGKYFYRVFSLDPNKATPLLNHLFNHFFITLDYLHNANEKLKENKMNNEVGLKIQSITVSIQKHLLYLSGYLDLSKVEYVLKDLNFENDIEISLDVKVDKRFRDPIPSPKIAHAINYFFRDFIEKLNQVEKIKLLHKITGRSGKDIYQHYIGGGSIKSSEKAELEKEFIDLKNKMELP